MEKIDSLDRCLTPAPTVLLAVVSAALLIRFRLNSAWLVLAGALMGVGLSSFGK